MRRIFLWSLVATLIALAPAASGKLHAIQDNDPFVQRLAELESLLEEKRVEAKLPGLGVAIIKDDKVVFLKGFGHADIENETPIDGDTMFAIGSSTKSFTSTLIAQLVAEGKMDWDDPITKYLPEFKMNVDTGDEAITIRDLLCHRTGFTRMGVLWAGGELERNEVITTAANAQPYSDFRKKFYYNNVMYMTAGVCAGKAMDTSWDSLVQERFFKPLNMTSTNATYAAGSKNPKMAKGYDWDKDRKQFKPKPMRKLDNIGPSGSINSTLNDMAKWVQMLLAGGEHDGNRLVDELEMEKTRTGQIVMQGDVWYGMGWMIRKWNGKRVVEHGGNIDGFSCQVTLLPEENIGYVLFTNVTVTPLQQGSISLIFDTLLGEKKKDSKPNEKKTTANLDDFTGKYVAYFGPFNGDIMEVKKKDDTIGIDVPGQTLYGLKSPDEEGKWYFEMTNQIAVSFNRNDKGDVISINMHQQGMSPEFFREGYEAPSEVPLVDMLKLTGTYHDEKTEIDVDVQVKNNRLVVHAGRAGTFVLAAPDEEGKWATRANPDVLKLKFNEENGKTVSMTKFQFGKEQVMKRVDKTEVSELPRLDDLFANMEKAAGSLAVDAIKLKGTINLVHQGATGTTELTFSKDGKMKTYSNLPRMLEAFEGFDGEQAYLQSNLSEFEELVGNRKREMELKHPMWMSLARRNDYTDVAIKGVTNIEMGADQSESAIIVKFDGEELNPRTLYVSTKTWLVIQEEWFEGNSSIGDLPVKMTYKDYRNVEGLMMPFEVHSSNDFSGRTELKYSKAESIKNPTKETFAFSGE